MKSKKQLLHTVLCLLLILTLIPTPVYAASKSETAVRKQTVKFLKQVKKYNEKGVTNCFLPKDMRKTLDMYPQSSKQGQVVRSLQKKYFQYEIKSISVKGKKATVKVKATYYDGCAVFTNAFWDTVQYSLSHPNLTDAEYDKYLAKYQKKYIKQYGKNLTSKTVTITFAKYKGKWKIKNTNTKLDDMLNCRFTRALRKIEKQLK